MQKRFVEPRLKLLGNDEDAALGVEHGLGLRLLDRLAHRKRVEALFGVGGAALGRVFYWTGERDHDIYAGLAALLQRFPNGKEISDCRPARVGNDHHLCTWVFAARHAPERVDNDGALLKEIPWMQVLVADDRLGRLAYRHFGVLLCRLYDLIARLVGRVVGENIVYESLFYGLAHRVGVERTERAVPLPRSEDIKRNVFRRGSKREIAQVPVPAMRAHHKRELSLGRVKVILVDLLARLLFVFGNGFREISQRDFLLCRALPGLARMCLVDDYREPLADHAFHVLEDDRELLQSRNDNPLAVVDCGQQVLCMLLLVDHRNLAKRGVEAHHRSLKLLVENTTIGNDYDRVEYRLVIIVEKACKAIADPCDGVGLARSRRMLDKIISPGTIRLNICNELAHNVKLMEARKYDLLLLRLEVHELLNDVEQRVFRQNVTPQIVCRRLGACFPLWIGGWIPRAAILTCASRPLVKRQKARRFASELRGHPCFVQIDSEKHENPMIQPKSRFLRIAVCHPLQLRILERLTRERVFQFNRDKRNAIHRKHHVNALRRLACAVVPLADEMANILFVVRKSGFVEFVLRLEITDHEMLSVRTKAIPQDINQTLRLNGALKLLIKLFCRVKTTARFRKSRPCLRLATFYKGKKRSKVKRQFARLEITGFRALLPTKLANHQRFDVALELVLVIGHLPPPNVHPWQGPRGGYAQRFSRLLGFFQHREW